MKGGQGKRDAAKDTGRRSRKVVRQVANLTKVTGPVVPNYRTQDKKNQGGKDGH